MSQVLRDLNTNKRMDVPTMIKMLMAVYENVVDDEVMEEVEEALGDAICVLDGMRHVARQVMLEGPTELEFCQPQPCRNVRNLC